MQVTAQVPWKFGGRTTWDGRQGEIFKEEKSNFPSKEYCLQGMGNLDFIPHVLKLYQL